MCVNRTIPEVSYETLNAKPLYHLGRNHRSKIKKIIGSKSCTENGKCSICEMLNNSSSDNNNLGNSKIKNDDISLGSSKTNNNLGKKKLGKKKTKKKK